MSQPTETLISRRSALRKAGCGFGYLAVAAMAGKIVSASPGPALSPKLPHFSPRAKRIIFIFMQGGPSHVDTFDYKPLLEKQDGKMVAFDDARVIANTGKRGSLQRVMKPLWNFSQHGESGHWVSELFPHMARHVDDLCFIHSMQTEGVAHGPATLFLHCGSTNFTRPSMGSWVSYGLGTENENLPAFVTIAPSMGNGGPRNYGSAFLPSIFQGTPLGRAGMAANEIGIRNLGNDQRNIADQRRQFELIQKLSQEQLKQNPGDSEMEAIIQSYELAWRMQSNAPDAIDISRESAETKSLYGIGEKDTDNFGRQCLMARRLSEAGVRFVQVTYGDNTANPAWDQHSNLPKHAEHARAVDKPIAGLLEDLQRRGLLDDTIVWWGSEFGRTPYAEKNGTGRDHNPGGFTVWLTGGGIKRGFSLGETDEFGHLAVRDRVHMHDLHATLLHLLGLNHEQLTFRHDGRDFRLTDVFGDIVHSIIA